MKAILEFDLNDEDDKLRHAQCVRSSDMASALWDITYTLRKNVEWKQEAGEEVTADYVFEEIFKVLDDNNINLDELM